MPTLECLGVFIAPGVPEDWIASGRPGEFYQLEPPSKDAAIHISVYSRNGRPLEDRKARNVLGQFVSRALDSKEGQVRFLDEGPEQQRAFTQLTRPDGPGEVQEWLAACIL